jgi:hypothetical protein
MQIMNKIVLSTVRMVGSSHAGLFASISAGVSALGDLYTEEQIKQFLKC